MFFKHRITALLTIALFFNAASSLLPLHAQENLYMGRVDRCETTYTLVGNIQPYRELLFWQFTNSPTNTVRDIYVVDKMRYAESEIPLCTQMTLYPQSNDAYVKGSDGQVSYRNNAYSINLEELYTPCLSALKDFRPVSPEEFDQPGDNIAVSYSMEQYAIDVEHLVPTLENDLLSPYFSSQVPFPMPSTRHILLRGDPTRTLTFFMPLSTLDQNELAIPDLTQLDEVAYRTLGNFYNEQMSTEWDMTFQGFTGNSVSMSFVHTSSSDHLDLLLLQNEGVLEGEITLTGNEREPYVPSGPFGASFSSVGNMSFDDYFNSRRSEGWVESAGQRITLTPTQGFTLLENQNNRDPSLVDIVEYNMINNDLQIRAHQGAICAPESSLPSWAR